MRQMLLLLLVAMLSAGSVAAAERAMLSPLAAGATLSTTPPALADLASLQGKASAKGHIRVIVGLRVPFAPEGALAQVERATQRQEIATASRALRARFAAAVNGRPSAVRSYSALPFMALEVTPKELAALTADPMVLSISENVRIRSNLAESGALVRAPEAWAAGFSGAGQTIAILDTGVDKDHPFLAGKVVAEACYSLGGFCPGGATSSTAINSGRPCSFSEDCVHGTHVAGIAAGRGSTASGVAPDAGIIAIQIFSPDPDSPGYAVAYLIAIMAGLTRVLDLRNSHTVAAVNLSLGGGQFRKTCDTVGTPITAAIANLRSAGIATIVSSGNDYLTNALSFPACISKAVSVGAVSDSDWGNCYDDSPTDVDKVACYSNSASFLSLLAPGSKITSSVPGGGYESWDGTSMAAPHVAGAWAVIKQKYPDASVAEVLGALQATGKPVTDTRSAKSRRPITKPRIDVAAALNGLQRLSIATAGTGGGVVNIATPRGTTPCIGDCSLPIVAGTMVKLTARADRGSRFTGWSGGGCSRPRPCTLPFAAALTVTATFNKR